MKSQYVRLRTEITGDKSGNDPWLVLASHLGHLLLTEISWTKNEFRAWTNNYIYIKLCYVIIHPCHTFKYSVCKPPLKLGHGWLAHLNSLWPSDGIWPHRYWSTLAHVMAYCLTAPSHYLNQCWINIKSVLWHSHARNFMRIVQDINP